MKMLAATMPTNAAAIHSIVSIKRSSEASFVSPPRGLRGWCVGDADAIEDLLSRVRAVGVKTRIGLGTLLPFGDGSLWRVTPDPEAEQLWRRRSSPVRLIDDSFRAIGSWHSPYWQGTDPIWRPTALRLPDDVVAAA